MNKKKLTTSSVLSNSMNLLSNTFMNNVIFFYVFVVDYAISISGLVISFYILFFLFKFPSCSISVFNFFFQKILKVLTITINVLSLSCSSTFKSFSFSVISQKKVMSRKHSSSFNSRYELPLVSKNIFICNNYSLNLNKKFARLNYLTPVCNIKSLCSPSIFFGNSLN